MLGPGSLPVVLYTDSHYNYNPISGLHVQSELETHSMGFKHAGIVWIGFENVLADALDRLKMKNV